MPTLYCQEEAQCIQELLTEMQKEITALAPPTMKIKIIAPPERNILHGLVAPF